MKPYCSQCAKPKLLPYVGRGGLPRKGNTGKVNPFVATRLSPDAQSLLQQQGTIYRVQPAPGRTNKELVLAYFRIGMYLAREERYDRPLYDKKHLCQCSKDSHTLYFFMNEGRVIGALAFVLSRYTNLKPLPELCFVWLMPEYRRKGLLSQAWDTLRANHSPFILQPPYSDAMTAFKASRQQSQVRTSDGIIIPTY